MKYQKLKMETKQKLKVGDEIVCIIDDIDRFTKNKIYYIKGVYNSTFNIIDDDGYERVFLIINIGEYFKLKEEKEELKPHSFCETPEEKCTLGYCDENGCMNRKRVLVEPELNVAYKETNGKLFYELDFEFITQMAERMASNKVKYEPYNWQKLDNVEELKQALFRHTLEVMKGNLEDDGRDFGHLEAIACDVMMIYYQLKKNRQKITK